MEPFRAWEPARRIEHQYAQSLKRLIRFCVGLINDGDGPWTIIHKLQRISESGALNSFASRSASSMVTNQLTDTAKTWREAARLAGRGREMFGAQQNLFGGVVGDRARELIDRNAQYIKTVPQSVAKDLTRFISTEAFADNPKSYEKDSFRHLVGDMVLNHTKLIARTETAKSHSALVQAQAEDTGHDWYIWHSTHDVRTRDSHRHMDGVLCRFSAPPAPEELSGEKSAGHYNPGEIYNCRCYASVVILWKRVTWPCKVCDGESIVMMGKREFQERFGVNLNAA